MKKLIIIILSITFMSFLLIGCGPDSNSYFEPECTSVNMNQSIGVDMAELDFASDDMLIFHSYAGLFFYDVENNRMKKSKYKPMSDAVEIGVTVEVLGTNNLAVSYQCFLFDEGECGYLKTEDWTFGTLQYVRGDKIIALF